MPSDRKRSLVLNRETIRVLSSQEMAFVGGGANDPPPFTTNKPPASKTCCACTHHCKLV